MVTSPRLVKSRALRHETLLPTSKLKRHANTAAFNIIRGVYHGLDLLTLSMTANHRGAAFDRVMRQSTWLNQ